MSSFSVPFSGDDALDKSPLNVQQDPSTTANNLPPSISLPTPSPHSLNSLPGEPAIELSHDPVYDYLRGELYTPVLTELSPVLWIVGTRAGDHIDPLHLNTIKGRAILISEDPNLHLVWSAKAIYIKPIPICLWNHQTWTKFLLLNASSPLKPCHDLENIRKSAVGFLRSYRYLIRHRSDFILAQQALLIPDSIEWTAWQKFMLGFQHIDDADVSDRYQYGQLRLSRLNWIVRILQPYQPKRSNGWFYHIPYWSTTAYLRHMLAPLLYVFASISVSLSAMQVMSGTGNNTYLSNFDQSAMQNAFWYICLVILVLTAVSWCLMIIPPLFVLIWQLQWGYRHRMGDKHRQGSKP